LTRLPDIQAAECDLCQAEESIGLPNRATAAHCAFFQARFSPEPALSVLLTPAEVRDRQGATGWCGQKQSRAGTPV
jgi:hypothetical protein